jgi:hypothetical protein
MGAVAVSPYMLREKNSITRLTWRQRVTFYLGSCGVILGHGVWTYVDLHRKERDALAEGRDEG